MNFIIERSCIADVEHAGRFATPQGVRHVPWQTNIRVPTERCRGAILCDIGKVPLDPHIELVTGMAVVRKGIVGREVDQQLPSACREIAVERRHPGARRDPLPFEGFPDNFLQVNERLPWPKGEGVFVRGEDVCSARVGAAHQQCDEGEENRCETAWRGETATLRVAHLTVHRVSFPGEGSSLHTLSCLRAVRHPPTAHSPVATAACLTCLGLTGGKPPLCRDRVSYDAAACPLSSMRARPAA